MKANLQSQGQMGFPNSSVVHLKKRWILFCAFLFSYSGIYSQTWQNSFFPVSEDNYTAGVAVEGTYWSIGNTDGFAAINPTDKILFSHYSAAGAVLFHRVIYDGTAPFAEYHATDIQAGYETLLPSINKLMPKIKCDTFTCFTTDAVLPTPAMITPVPEQDSGYFYVSGWVVQPGELVERLMILKLSSTGTVIWTRINSFPVTTTTNERGVSVESCPNGDVIAVSQVTEASGFIYPAVTRLTTEGVTVWRFTYPDLGVMPGIPPPFNFAPRQSCIYREDLTATATDADPIGITITGKAWSTTFPSAYGFFVMRVRFDGLLIYKIRYPRIDIPNVDIGLDIIHEHPGLGTDFVHAENFVLTGLDDPIAPVPSPASDAFIAKIDVMGGGYLGAYTVNTPAPVSSMYGQSIVQSPIAIALVRIAGGADSPPMGIFTDTYSFETDHTLPFPPPVGPISHYPATTPNFEATESIVEAADPVFGAIPGYYISTNAFAIAPGTLTDAHAIRCDLAGNIVAPACFNPIVPSISGMMAHIMFPHCTKQPCEKMQKVKPKSKKVTVPAALCFAPKMGEDEWLVDALNIDSDISIFPNPANELISPVIAFGIEQDSKVTIQLISISGKLMKEYTFELKAGDHELSLQLPSLAEGIYLVKIFDGVSMQTGKLMIQQ